jgi:acetyl/propionyl-CoA carboxylase alpha subunit
MLSSLLIANRGEIARRIMRTARRLGVRTIAVYSDADAGAAFVREADCAVRIGEAPAARSYLNVEAILEAADATGAEAIHPGYGFLSENPEFAEAVTAAGMTWVGPPPEAIRAMGLKDAAKALMQAKGVPVTPGYHGEDQSLKRIRAEARELGYPILIKAVAGGGGRGMRRVDAPSGLDEALASARREAASAFGDDRVLIEKFVSNPRHIEVQVFGDNHGGLIHLYERDCSLQRRRQKVIEEAPAPGMTPEVREAMTRAALDAARAVGYRNAGTVEFIVDGSGPLRPDGFWFMEMNTRLQVEHPVTEWVTGLDLVQLQLEVACGGRVPAQESIRLDGCAIEARLCAEDPARGFLPSAGSLRVFDLPAFTAPRDGPVRFRLDSAVEEGDETPPDYDSMIAKAIVHAPDRSGALTALAGALRGACVYPVATNACLLANLLDHPEMRAGNATTALVERDLPDLLRPRATPEALYAAAAQGLEAFARSGSVDPWGCPDGFRLNAPARSTFAFEVSGETVTVKLETAFDGARAAEVGDQRLQVTGLVSRSGERAEIAVPEDRTGARAVVRRLADGPVLFFGGLALALRAPFASAGVEALEAGDEIRAPMPGKILDVRAEPGLEVTRGQPLLVMEAMKMEHTLEAPRDGRILEVRVSKGDQTSEGAVLVRLEPPAA